jgi:hypothetical protein
MRIPRLFDWKNPNGPQWEVPVLTEADLDALSEILVMFVGYDPRPGTPDRCEALGSGFIVAAGRTLVAISAAHIFSWWTDQILPPRRYKSLYVPVVHYLSHSGFQVLDITLNPAQRVGLRRARRPAVFVPLLRPCQADLR